VVISAHCALADDGSVNQIGLEVTEGLRLLNSSNLD
jgi:hypothetical protein